MKFFASLFKTLHFFYLLFPFFSLCQETGTFTIEKTIQVKADFISVDNLGNVYLAHGDQLHKYNSHFEKVNAFSSKMLGKITAIDVSNPMKILLYFKNLSQVLFLDNTLSAQGEAVALESRGLGLSTLVCSSVNNGIWVYDQRNFQLIRLDQNLKTIAETGNIIQQTGGELNPVYLLEKNNWIYLNDSSRGILVFDIFGTYGKTIPLKGLVNFQILEDLLFFSQENKFFTFSMKTLEQKEIKLTETGFKQILTDGKRFFILMENELRIYLVQDLPER